MAYTTLTKVNSLFGITMTQAVFDDLLAAVKLFIDRYTGKTFEGSSVTQYYDGNGSDVLNVDSFYGTPVIEILNENGDVQETLDAGDFITAPYNSLEKNQIILTRNGGIGSFSSGLRRIKITATHGFGGTVPADIQLVATRMIGELFNGTISSTTGDIKSESLGDYAVTYSETGGSESVANSIGAYGILDLHRDIDV